MGMETEIKYLILFGSTFFTGLVFINISAVKQKWVKFLLTFSGAFLFAFTILHFIPDIYRDYKWQTGLFVLLGFTIQILLEFMSQGIDHGHVHLNTSKPLSISALIGLYIHALLEAMPLAAHEGHHHHHNHSGDYLLMGLILHKIPVAIILGTLLQHHFKNKIKSTLVLLSFAIMAPIGLFLADYFKFLYEIQQELMAIVVGIFLYISTTILFEINKDHKFNAVKLISIMVGFAVAIAVSV